MLDHQCTFDRRKDIGRHINSTREKDLVGKRGDYLHIPIHDDVYKETNPILRWRKRFSISIFRYFERRNIIPINTCTDS